MTAPSRSAVVSSFTVIKGAMIDETYATFAAWNLGCSKKENLDRLRESNAIGAGSITWLRDVGKVLNRRFDPDGRDLPLVVLAKAGMPLEEWKPLLLWHMSRDEFLVRDFITNWLFESWQAGAYLVRAEEVGAYLGTLSSRGGQVEHDWSPSTSARVAVGLLRLACDFGLLRGTKDRVFASYHLPERSLMYLLHALRDARGSASAALAATDWRLFLLRREVLEQELLRLHQFQKLQYQVAGSLVELSLPCPSALEYAKRMIDE